MKHAGSPAKPGLTCDNGNVSDPRNAPTFGGLAGTWMKGTDMATISPTTPLRASGDAA